MAVVNDTYVTLGQPDGYADQSVARSRVFKQTVDNFGTTNAGDTLASGVNYAAIKLPPGFIPRFVVANVIKANASAVSVTVNVAKNATNLASATVAAANASASTFASGTAGRTLISFASATADEVTTGTDPWLTGNNDYIVLTPGGAVDAKFEVLVVGDWVDLTGVDHLPKLA